MLKITKTAPNRLEIELSGSLEADVMRQGLEDLLSQSEGMSGGQMLYTIRTFSWPTLAAVAVELGYLPRLFGLISRFDKCAVCTDAGWIRTAAEVEGVLIPGLEIKAFPLEDVEQAEAWLNS